MKKKTGLQPQDKRREVKERDKKGRYAKGHKGGPGRPKGEPRDIICKDGKKRSVETLIDDLLDAYETLGGPKFLKSWAAHSHRNLAKFVELLFKFAPRQPEVLIEQDIKALTVNVTKTITDEAPGELRDFHVKNLEQQIQQQEEELGRLKGLLASKEIKLLEHYPDRSKKDDEGPGGGGSSRVN